jgi:hypothetical protein
VSRLDPRLPITRATPADFDRLLPRHLLTRWLGEPEEPKLAGPDDAG